MDARLRDNMCLLTQPISVGILDTVNEYRKEAGGPHVALRLVAELSSSLSLSSPMQFYEMPPFLRHSSHFLLAASRGSVAIGFSSDKIVMYRYAGKYVG